MSCLSPIISTQALARLALRSFQLMAGSTKPTQALQLSIEFICCRVTKQTGLFPFCGKYDKHFTTLSYSGNRISHGGKYTHAPLQCASSRRKFSTQATLLFTPISYTCKLFIALASDLSL
jgi:hypothetical protein